MKKTLKNAMLLALFASSTAMASQEAEQVQKPQLQMSCSIFYSTLDKDGKTQHVDLTPKSVKPVDLEISVLGSSSPRLKDAEINFTTQSPDGDIEVTGVAMAIDLDGSGADIQMHLFSELKNKQVGLNVDDTRTAFKYNDLNFPQAHIGASISTGKTAQGYAVNMYGVSCEVTKK